MRKNEILEEVWRNRDEFAREHNYDLDAMVAALQEMEKHPLTKVVDRRRKKPEKTIKKRKQ
jgi:hypothetical protein